MRSFILLLKCIVRVRLHISESVINNNVLIFYDLYFRLFFNSFISNELQISEGLYDYRHFGYSIFCRNYFLQRNSNLFLCQDIFFITFLLPIQPY